MSNYIFRPVIYDLCGGAVNSYVIETAHYVLLIDTAVASARESIENTLIASHIMEKQLMILNTHGHWDHTSLNRYFAEKYGALTLAHKNAENWCSKEEQFEKIYSRFLRLHPDQCDIRSLYDREYEEHPPACIGLVGGESIRDGDFFLQVIATPGHSEDSISFFEPERKLLFAGDAVQGNGFDGNAPFYCDADSYLGSLSRMAQLCPEAIYCGHGIAEGRAASEAFLRQSEDAFRCIDRAARQYRSMEEAVKDTGAVAWMLGCNDSMHLLTTMEAHMKRLPVWNQTATQEGEMTWK